MRGASLSSRVLACVFLALVGGAFRAPQQAAGQEGVEMALPEGVKAVWDVGKAYRESTETRERICINGLWRWQPAKGAEEAVPASGWGYFRVPSAWPREAGAGPSQVMFQHPDWKDVKLGEVTAAWYQREVAIPKEWAGRGITLHTECLNSFAAVYVDGKKTGEMRYPWGDADLTAACRPGAKHVVSMMVVAMPLRAVMLSYNDTASAREVRGSVQRRGLCGDVYLDATPAGPRISDIRVETSVRRWEISLDTALDAADANAQYMLRAQIKDGEQVAREFTTQPFKGSELADGHIVVSEHWRPEKLWDTITPQNQYDLSLSLLDAKGKVLDTALPVRFGFREFWIDGRDFYLNGTRIYLSAIPIDNGQMSPLMASYEAVRATLQRYRSFGINFVYTHNYGCEPGTHLSFEDELKAADDEGFLLSFSQPHFGHYDWDAPDADQANGYARHAAFYVHVAQNHPSVVCYSTSHNSTGYAEDMNPDMIDGIQNPRDPWALRNAGRALRAEGIIRRLDPSRFVYHHSSGSLSSMHTSNFYANWTPIQEMSDWFEHWATLGVKPVFTCEYSVPFLWDYAMYRGWYKGKREFGSAFAPWEFCVAEWDAQFFGPRAYKIMDEEKQNLRWEALRFREGKPWQRWDYPFNLNTQVFPDRFDVVAMYLTDNWRAFRTWGMSANSPWEYGSYWIRPEGGRGRADPEGAIDWDGLQRPGPRPAYVDEKAMKAQLAFDPAAHRATATVAATSLYRNNMPLLAYIAGTPAAFTSKDHNFLPGEKVEKQLIVINNSRLPVTADCSWTFGLPRAVADAKKVALPTGQQARIPLAFELPAELAPGSYDLKAAVKFSTGEAQEDSCAIDVLPAPAAVKAPTKIALFDPKGETAKMLAALGVEADAVAADADLSSYDTLIVGKAALTLDGPAPDVARVRTGLKVVMFEQTPEVREKRLGFRVEEYGLRWVFRRVPDHPLLAGISDEQLRNWRGEATIIPSRLTYERAQQFNYVPTVKWCDILVTRAWRCGNRGNVASVLIEKPACGDFLPILDGGYSLQYSPLIEYRAGKGMVLFCQMDVTGRTESDPAAEALARNIIRYAADWKPAPSRKALYVGDPAGKAYLEAGGLALADYAGGPLAADQALIVGPGGGQQLAASARAVADFVKAGGRLVAVGLDEQDANAFLPSKVTSQKAEHIAAYFEPFGKDSPLVGVSPADVHNRDPREMSLISAGATAFGDGVLAKGDGNVVFFQMAPWEFDYSGEKMNIKRTFRRASFALTRLMANEGVAAETPLLEHVASPVQTARAEKRWLDGLYRDVPEEWDDPYRFFRW